MSEQLHRVLFGLAKSLRADAREARQQSSLAESEKLKDFFAGMETAFQAIAHTVELRACDEYVSDDKVIPLRKVRKSS
jgi:hypothetical protein